MKESILTNKTFQFIIRSATAVSFTLFTVYQCFLAIYVEESRVGRLIGIVLYLFITLAAYFDFSGKNSFWMLHSIFLVTGLVLLFALRMLNLPGMISSFRIDNMPSVLNIAVYAFTQLGTLILVAGFLLLRTRLKKKTMVRLTIILMIAVIVLFVLSFIMECVLLLVYRSNIDLSRKFTLISRFLFCAAFVGTAVSFMLPVPDTVEKIQEGRYIYSEADEDEVDLVI